MLAPWRDEKGRRPARYSTERVVRAPIRKSTWISRARNSEDSGNSVPNRQQLDSINHLKMTTVIGAEGQTVADRGAGDEQVAIADRSAQFPEPSPLLSEQIADLLVDGKHDNTCHKLL